MIYKAWRLECTTCHQITKHMGWDHEPFPTACACGGELIEEMLLKRVGGVIPDDIPGGMVMEHIVPGHKVYSRTELKEILTRHGYSLSDGWCGPNDRYLSRWI